MSLTVKWRRLDVIYGWWNSKFLISLRAYILKLFHAFNIQEFGARIILILDSASIHFTDDVKEAAIKYKIKIIGLLPY